MVVVSEGAGFHNDSTVAAWDTPAARAEKQMTLVQAIKLYPKAVGWSVLLSLALIMEGYDISLIAAFFAFPPFQKRYGVEQPDGTYEITAPWQSGLSNGALVGEIIGLAINGYVSERFGYKKTMIGSLALLTAFIFIPFFATNLETLVVGFILQGIPWGVFQTLTTAYASEVAPTALRAYLTIFVNFCWAAGFLIGSGVLKGLLDRGDEWAYR
jgi:SP family general alpha glucoside:H+ symporter-like MFS transporter